MVPIICLDDVVEGPVDFLKMDVERAERQSVSGATRLIVFHRPIITTEFKQDILDHVSALSVADYLGYFEDLGYLPAVLESSTGAEKPYPSVAPMLEAWGGDNETSRQIPCLQYRSRVMQLPVTEACALLTSETPVL